MPTSASGPLRPRPARPDSSSRARVHLGRGRSSFRRLCQAAAILVIVLAAALVAVLVWQSWLSLTTNGLEFFVSTEWDPEPTHRKFGALVFVYGTVVTSVIAMLIAVPLGRRHGGVPGGDRPARRPQRRLVPGGDAGGHPQRRLRLLGPVRVRPVFAELVRRLLGGPDQAGSACFPPASSWRS